MALRLLLFSDLHADPDRAEQIAEQSAGYDIAIGAGDFGSLRRQLMPTIEALAVMKCPCILVAGNNESTEELRLACQGWESAHVLHGSGVTVKGVQFWGVGGGIPQTPFGHWSYDFSESQAEELLRDCPRDSILVSHSPPQGILDCSSQGVHLGSCEVLKAIERTQPRLVVCGHIHACAGQQTTLGKTVIVNAGPMGMEFCLPDRCQTPS